jgi:hypothetical protein
MHVGVFSEKWLTVHKNYGKVSGLYSFGAELGYGTLIYKFCILAILRTDFMIFS